MSRHVYVNDALHLPNEQPVTIVFLPFYHVYGLIGVMMRALVSKHRLVVLPRFDAELLLSCIEKYKVIIPYLDIAYPHSTRLFTLEIILLNVSHRRSPIDSDRGVHPSWAYEVFPYISEQYVQNVFITNFPNDIFHIISDDLF